MFHKYRKREGGGMIKSLIRIFIVNAAALYFLSQYIPGFQLNEGLKSLLIISIAFSLLHIILRPIFGAFLGGINFLTFGLIGVLIDSIILLALSHYFPQITLSPWHFPGAEIQGFQIPSYNFNEYSTIGLIAFCINLLQTFIHLLV